jgi:hypothetical protein
MVLYLHFNLDFNQKYHCEADNTVTTSSSWSSNIPVATEINISVVNSPYYHVKGVHTEAVKAYFQVPRYKLFIDIQILNLKRDRRGRDRMVVGFTTTYAISAYHH